MAGSAPAARGTASEWRDDLAKGPRHTTQDRVDRVRCFFENFLVHTKGRWATKPFYLTDWQLRDIIEPLFGTVRYGILAYI